MFGTAKRTQDRMQELNSTPPSPAVGDEEASGGNDRHLSRPHHHGNTLLMKIIGPVITFVDRPWKVSVASARLKREFRPRSQDVPGGTTVWFW